jgi:hypothetical protein
VRWSGCSALKSVETNLAADPGHGGSAWRLLMRLLILGPGHGEVLSMHGLGNEA